MSRRITVLSAWLFASSAALAGNGVWTSSGPDGGLVYDVVAHPTNPGITFALARSGVFRSDDAGFSWSRIAAAPAVFVGPNSSIAIDAEQPGDVYVFTPGDRLYRSADGGDSWAGTAWTPPTDRLLSRIQDVPGEIGALFTTVRSFEASPPAVSPLLKSTSFGDTFASFGNGLPLGQPAQTLAFAPGSPATMLLGVGSYGIGSGMPNPASLYRSIDGGANWTPVYVEVTTGANLGFASGVVGLTYADATRAYAQISSRVRRSDDGGLTWLPVQATPATMAIPSGSSYSNLFAVAAEPMTVWAYGSSGLRKSTDGGVNFVDVTSGLSPNPSYTPVTPPLTPVQGVMMRMTASSNFQPGVAGDLWLASDGSGLFRSLDWGSSWSMSHAGLQAVNIRAIAAHPGQHAGNRPTPGSPAQRIYAGIADTSRSSTGHYASTDAGNSWNVFNNGLKAGQIRSIVIDPSSTGGVEPNGQPSNPPAVAPPPLSSTRMFAVGRSSTTPLVYRNGGIYRSINGGASWSVVDAGMPTRTFTNQGTPPTTISVADVGLVRHLALDPRSCSPAVFPCLTPLQRMWASASGHFGATSSVPAVDPHCDGGVADQPAISHRLLRSVDGGTTWAASDAGLPAPVYQDCLVGGSEYHSIAVIVTPLHVLVSPNTPNVLYAGTFVNYFEEPAGHTLPDLPSGVFKSTDGGDSWTAVSNGLPARAGYAQLKRDVLALAIHPNNDQILWASVIEFLTPGTSAIYKTIDGGANWTLSSDGIPDSFDIRALIVDATAPDILYAAGAGSESDPGSVYKSEDGGATWRSISVGLPADSALSLALDPFNPNILHAGLLSGVWSLTQVPDEDGDGVPDGTENNAPGGGDGNGDSQPDAAQRDVGSTVVIFRRPEGVGGFFTSDIDTAASTPTGAGGCTQAVDVQAQLAAQFGRDYTADGVHFYKYPRDLVRFEILDCARALVNLTFHNAQFANEYGWSFRFFGPTTPGDDGSFAWADIGARVQRQAGSATTWRATLDANQFGSYRPVGDRILFVGGPACYDDRLFRNSMEDQPDTGPPSCDH